MAACYPSLAGQRVLITGAASGIGQATTQRFLDEGAIVLAADVDADALETNWGRHDPSTLVKVVCDVTDPAGMQAVFDAVASAGHALDFVFANAGISVRHDLLDIEPEAWRRVIDVNLSGVFNTVKPAAAMMHRRGSGGIAVMGSTNGLHAHRHYADYNVSKAGVIMLARSMALELAPVVRVNAICPGYVMTAMQKAEYTPEMLKEVDSKIPLGRHADPSEIAALIAFLASSEASYITGSVIAIDGGETA